MHYVYLIQSIKNSSIYVGYSTDLKNRMAAHQTGNSKHTSKNRPWKLKCYFAFEDKGAALDFENYLKAGSGQAFRKRHFKL